MILNAVLAFSALVLVVVLTSTVIKTPAPFGLVLSSLAAALVAGIGLPVTRMVEGSFGFFYIVLTFGCGLIFVKVMTDIGFNEAVRSFLLSRLAHRRAVLFLSLMGIVMLPGMLTGIGSVAVVSTGAVVASVLLGLGVPKSWTAVFVISGAILGMIAPPVNLPLMYIGVLIALPYEGFTAILLLLTVPTAVVIALWIGYRHAGAGTVPARDATAAAESTVPARDATAAVMPAYGTLTTNATAPANRAAGIVVYLPIVVVVTLLLLERLLPSWPELALPLVLMIGALTGLPLLGPRRFFDASRDALKGQAFLILMILLTAGLKGEFLSLSGVRGLLATFFFAVVPASLFLPSLISLPLLGAFGTVFGATFILGFPFVLALLPKSSIITAAALSLIAAVADIMPPTALSGNLAMHLVGETKYRSIFYRSLAPAGLMIAVAMAAIFWADPLSKLFG